MSGQRARKLPFEVPVKGFVVTKQAGGVTLQTVLTERTSRTVCRHREQVARLAESAFGEREHLCGLDREDEECRVGQRSGMPLEARVRSSM